MEIVIKMENRPEHILNVNVYNFGIRGLSTIVYNLGMKLERQQYIFDYCGWKPIPKSIYTESILNNEGRIFNFISNKNNKILVWFQRARYLKRIIKENKYKFVHIHADRAQNAIIFAFVAKLVGVERIIIHSHSSGIDNKKQHRKIFYHNISKLFFPFVATDYLACSEKAAKWMYPKKIIRNNTFEIINNGIEISEYCFEDSTRIKVRRALGWEDKYILAHIGHFSYQKNHEFLIKVFAAVFKRNKDARLLMIGQGELEKEVACQIEQLGLENHIKHITSTNEVSNYMKAMDVFLLPSRFEGLPLVAVEAQASGAQCVLSDKISAQAKLTDLVQYCPIDKGVEPWVEAIEHVDKIEYDRKSYAEKVDKKGYSIEASAQRLREIYSKTVK
ncbi:glycosyltransferase [Bariatricus massiliensis]|nr:glycosyltransferase [Bariatricus massiliensis]